ncbi:MAG: hypothetical protein HFI90_03850 [Clostridia bacterium]|nr:hypothetical protein [Clostridia bacterium]
MTKKIIALLCALLLFAVPTALCAPNPEYIIPAQYDSVSGFYEGRAAVNIGAKHGFIDESGALVIPLLYDFVTDFHNGFSIACRGEKYGILDRDGNERVPFIYDDMDIELTDNEPIYACKDGKYGFIDAFGNVLIPFEYDTVNMVGFSSGLCAVQKENTLYGFIDESGQTVVPFDIRFAGNFRENVAPVHNGEKWGLMLHDGSVPLGYVFDKIGWSMNEGVIAVCKDEKWALSDGTNMITEFLYDDFGMFMTEGRFPTLLNEKWGCLNAAGEVAIPFEFDAIGSFENGLAAAAKDGQYGLIDREGNTKLAFGYDNLSAGENGVWIATQGGKTGAVTETGQEVIPFLYQSLIYQDAALIPAELDGSWGFIYNPRSGAPKPQPAAANPALDALRPSLWAQPEIKIAAENGLLENDLLERYSEDITRLEFCRLLGTLTETITDLPLASLLEEKGITLPTNVFSDTIDESVLTMYALGVVTGTAPGLFSPEDTLTRQEAAVFFARLLRALDISVTYSDAVSFQDESSFASWAKEAIVSISALTLPDSEQPVLAGTGGNLFCPLEPLSREQAYVITYRFWAATSCFLPEYDF